MHRQQKCNMYIIDEAAKMSEHCDKTDTKSVAVKKKKKQWLSNSGQCGNFCVLFFRLQPLSDA